MAKRPREPYHARALLLLVVFLLAVSCTNAERPRALVNSAPYWCHLLPQEAIRIVSDSSTGEEVELRGGLLDDNKYFCSVRDTGAAGSLATIRVDRRNETPRAVRLARGATGDEAVPIPKSVGEGETYMGFGWALWRCDNEPVYISIDLYPSYLQPDDAPDRDVTRDLVALLRVAQQRYAELAECEVKAPPTMSSSPATPPWAG